MKAPHFPLQNHHTQSQEYGRKEMREIDHETTAARHTYLRCCHDSMLMLGDAYFFFYFMITLAWLALSYFIHHYHSLPYFLVITSLRIVDTNIYRSFWGVQMPVSMLSKFGRQKFCCFVESCIFLIKELCSLLQQLDCFVRKRVRLELVRIAKVGFGRKVRES